jgi:hypothetical protein
MTIHRPASHKPLWWRPKAAILTAATAAIALAAVPAFAASAAATSPAQRPNITSVSFSGTAGPGVASPTITITGPPAAFALPISPPNGVAMPAAWVREALLHGEDLAPLSGSGSAPSAAVPAVTRIVVVGGMPAWRIALIVIGTALVAAAAAVLLDRTWAARRRPDNKIRPAAGRRSGQPDDDPKFPDGQVEIPGDDADLIGTADLAVPRTRPTPPPARNEPAAMTGQPPAQLT